MVCVPEPIDILRCGPAEWSEILRRGARAWNAWRDDYPWIIPDLTGIAPSVIECQLGPLTGGPVNLANARLRGARLGRATLSEANLEGADLSEADLTHARLDRANLSYANLRNANLDRADLSRARLMRADLSGANLGKPRVSWKVSCSARSATGSRCCRRMSSAPKPGRTLPAKVAMSAGRRPQARPNCPAREG